MRNILITGGAGMIGSNLVKRLVKNGDTVVVVDNLWRGKKEYLQNENGEFVIDMKTNFFQIDLSIPNSLDEVFDKFKFDYIFHLADVVAGIGYVFNNQGGLFRQNILINSNVIDSIRAKCKDLKGYIYAGTICSFPAEKQMGVDSAPLVESDQYPANPESAYGWSKLMGEYEAFLMEKECNIPVCIPVLHNVYGSPCDYSPERSQVIPSLIRKAIDYPNEDFIVWGNGEQGRAFIYVDDVIDGLVLCLDKGLGKGIIQLGPNYCTTIKEIAQTIVKISGKDINIKFDLSKPQGDKGRRADYSKAKTLLGWEPKTSIKEGIESTYRWVESQYTSNQ